MNNTAAKENYASSSHVQKVLRRSREKGVTAHEMGEDVIACLVTLGYVEAQPWPADSGFQGSTVVVAGRDAGYEEMVVGDVTYRATQAGQDAPTRLLTVKG